MRGRKTLKSFYETISLKEMAWKHATTQKWQLSPQAMWLISFMPNQATQPIALSWLMNKGLFEAAKARHQLAQEATKALGRDVYDHEIFSKKAHDADPNLKDLWDKTLSKRWEELEPKDIRFVHNGEEKKIDIQELNKLLPTGMQFSFGGPDGFIEWLEDGVGKWADKYTDQSPISGGDWHDRIGLDLSTPEFLRDKNTGKFFYRFGSNDDPANRFFPDHDVTSYDQAITDMRRTTGGEIEKALAGQPSILSPEAINWVKENKLKGSVTDKSLKNQLATRTKGGVSGGVKEVEVPDDEWEAAVNTLRRGIEYYNNNKATQMDLNRGGGGNLDQTFKDDAVKPWTKEEMEAMLNAIIDPNRKVIKEKVDDPQWKRLMIARAGAAGVTPGAPGYNHRNYKHSKTFMDLGVKNNSGGEPVPTSTLKNINYLFQLPKDDINKYVSNVDYDTKTVDLKDLLQQGYIPTEDLNKLPPGRAHVSFRKGIGNYLVADRDENGQWSVREPKSSTKPNKSDFSSGTPLVLKSDRFGSNDRFAAPVDDKKAAALQASWYSQPESFGDKMVKVGGQNVPGSLADAVSAATSKVNQSGVDLDYFRRKFDKESLLGVAQIAMNKLYGTWAFKYGDPLNKWPRSSRTPKGLKEDHHKNIYKMFADAGVSNEDAKKYIDELYQSYQNGREPNFDPTIKNVFLQNGYNWRVNQAASAIADFVRDEFNYEMKNKSGITAKGKDGDEMSIFNNVGDANSGQKQISDLATNPVDFSKKGKISKLRGVDQHMQVQGNLQQDIQTSNHNSNIASLEKMFTDTTAKNQPNIHSSKEYVDRYYNASKRLDRIQPDDFNSYGDANELDQNAERYARSLKISINDLTKGLNDTQLRGVIDAFGDFLNKTIQSYYTKSNSSNYDNAIANKLREKLQPVIQQYATKFPDYSETISKSASILDGLKPNTAPQQPVQAQPQQAPAIPTATQQVPATAVAQPTAAHDYGAIAKGLNPNKLANHDWEGIKKSLNPNKIKNFNIDTYQEWINWKKISDLRNGS